MAMVVSTLVSSNKLLQHLGKLHLFESNRLFPKKIELQALVKYYDTNNDDGISYEEFINGLRDPLTERRLKITEKAFCLLDKSGDGVITASDICNVYDVSKNPDLINNRLTKQQILENFLNQFDGQRGNNDGRITFAEWMDYYTDLSQSIASDEFYVRMMESTWQFMENDDPAVKQIVTKLAQDLKKIVQKHSKGGDPAIVTKIFRDFDLNQNNALTIDEVTGMLAKLQISVERKYVQPFFKLLDADNSGCVEIEEWIDFVCGKQ